MKIGFFDSGLGGLLVMEVCRKILPGNSYVYLGDTLNLPYGPRETKDILRLATPAIDYLLEVKSCDLVVVACNTISVRALDEYRKLYPHHAEKVIGINQPTEMYLTKSSLDSLLVLATSGSKIGWKRLSYTSL